MAERCLEKISIGDRLHPAQETEKACFRRVPDPCEPCISPSHPKTAKIRANLLIYSGVAEHQCESKIQRLS
ncbi:MAG: hypothetical protein O2890_10455 [Cyanobacteria bacterium]|nr:hypothetical protein [Cyanobacteriota bacterium]